MVIVVSETHEFASAAEAAGLLPTEMVVNIELTQYTGGGDRSQPIYNLRGGAKKGPRVLRWYVCLLSPAILPNLQFSRDR
jgi:hypothetical protein